MDSINTFNRLAFGKLVGNKSKSKEKITQSSSKPKLKTTPKNATMKTNSSIDVLKKIEEEKFSN